MQTTGNGSATGKWGKTLNRATVVSTENHNTPSKIVQLIRSVSPIALDPCSNPTSVVHAARNILLPRHCEKGIPKGFEMGDGLELDWWQATRFDDEPGLSLGLVYVNSPYGQKIGDWQAKCAAEAMRGTEIASLIPARPGSSWFQGSIFAAAQAVCFLAGRLSFGDSKNCAPFDSAIAYYGQRIDRFRDVFDVHGCVVLL